MKIGSLFSGIGGLELGLERAGVGRVVWQCEVDPFCRSILAKHWPTVTRYEDVRGLVPPTVDVVCGGFPCQDVSSGNHRAKGLDGERSGLWREYARIVEAIRPRIVIVENVASGARRWLPFVRRDLHLLGYRTRAFALSAADVGAPHLRRRVFVVADAADERGPRRPNGERSGERPRPKAGASRSRNAADADGQGEHAQPSTAASHAHRAELREQPGRCCGPGGARAQEPGHARSGGPAPHADEHDRSSGLEAPRQVEPEGRTECPTWAGGRFAQPDVVRVVHGLPRGVDGARRKALGNSVVPQCAEVIGRIVLSEVA